MAALQYVHIPSYSAILFRRTLTELKLAGALLDRAHSWLMGKRCEYVAGEHTYYFPTISPWGGYGEPAKIAFGYMGQDSAKSRYQSAEYQFCVATGTPVRMADGSLKPIEKIQVGDYVFTPQGSRLVTKKHGPKLKPCVRMGDQVQGINHRVLTSSGWISYADLLKNQYELYSATRSHVPHIGFSHSPHKSQSFPRTLDSRLSYLLQPFESASKYPVNSALSQEIGELLTDVETYCVTSGGLHPEFLQLPKLSVRVKLVSLSSQEDRRETLLDDGPSNAYVESSKQGYRGGYFEHHHRHDEQSQGVSSVFRSYLQEQGDVGTSSTLIYADLGAKERTPKRNPACLTSYTHPYTMEERHSDLIEGDQLFSFQPYGLSEVWDLTVQGENQYVSSSMGVNILSSNCGFDELTHYQEADYLWMFSRLRKAICSKHRVHETGPLKGTPAYEPGCPECEHKQVVPSRMRAASNPGNIGHKWVKARFKIEPVQGADGEVRYVGLDPERPFIPATVTDNPFIDQQTYLQNLDQLDPLTRAQMKKGDWGASLDARFKAHWFAHSRYNKRGEYFEMGPNSKPFSRSEFIKVFSVIDPAASSREGPGDTDRWKKPNKSWTVVTTWGLTENYNLLCLNMVRVYVESPDIVKLAKNVFRNERPQYFICEASGVGKAVYQALNRAGLPVIPIYPHQDKVVRSTEAQIRASKGQIWLPAHPGPHWLKDLEDELFVWIGHPHETDDSIDTISYAAAHIAWEAMVEDQANDPETAETLGSDLCPGIVTSPYEYGYQDQGDTVQSLASMIENGHYRQY